MVSSHVSIPSHIQAFIKNLLTIFCFLVLDTYARCQYVHNYASRWHATSGFYLCNGCPPHKHNISPFLHFQQIQVLDLVVQWHLLFPIIILIIIIISKINNVIVFHYSIFVWNIMEGIME